MEVEGNHQKCSQKRRLSVICWAPRLAQKFARWEIGQLILYSNRLRSELMSFCVSIYSAKRRAHQKCNIRRLGLWTILRTLWAQLWGLLGPVQPKTTQPEGEVGGTELPSIAAPVGRKGGLGGRRSSRRRRGRDERAGWRPCCRRTGPQLSTWRPSRDAFATTVPSPFTYHKTPSLSSRACSVSPCFCWFREFVILWRKKMVVC